MNSVAVFCGSGKGSNRQFHDSAGQLGTMIACEGIRLIYGGARVGVMGSVADAALKSGGEVVGVLPKFLARKEVAHGHLTELIMVETMHERKLKMSELSDGVITLPGAYGTMEEFFEMLTWAQLGLHRKPVVLMNIKGFYDPLAAQFETMEKEGLLTTRNKQLLLIESDPRKLLQMMKDYRPPARPHLMGEDQA